jgi:hypothetical protein
MDLQQRVERLDCQSRRLKWGGLCVLFMAGVVFVWQWGLGQSQPAFAQDKKGNVVITGDDITIKDKAGRERVRIGVDSNNRAYFQLRGNEINPGFGIAIDEKGLGDLAFFGKDGNEQIIIRTTQEGKPDIALRTGTVNFYDSKIGLFKSSINSLPGSAYNLTEGNGKVRASLMFDDKTGPALAMFDEKGDKRASLGLLSTESSPFLQMNDPKNIPRIFLGVSPPNQSGLALFDPEGYSVGTFWFNKLSGVFYDTFSQNPKASKARLMLWRNDEVSLIYLSDKTGKEKTITVDSVPKVPELPKASVPK